MGRSSSLFQRARRQHPDKVCRCPARARPPAWLDHAISTMTSLPSARRPQLELVIGTLSTGPARRRHRRGRRRRRAGHVGRQPARRAQRRHARSDTWAEHFGEPSGHGTWPYEAVRDGLVDPAQVRQRLSGGVPLYFSLDIYALDPSHAPGAGTPEPAGLTARKSRHCWKNCRTCRSSACI